MDKKTKKDIKKELEDTEELNKKLDLFFEIAEKVKKKQEKDWYEIDQFLDGNHYTVYLPKLDKLIEVRETKRGVRRTVNKVRKMMRAVQNILLRNEPNWNIKPRGKGEEAKKEADIASKYLRWFYRNKHLKEFLKDLVYLAFARGIGIGEVLETDEGIDLKLDIDVFDCYLDPSGKGRFFIKTFSKSKAELEETKNSDGNPVYSNLDELTSSKLAASNVKERLLTQQGYEKGLDQGDKDLRELLCYEFWIKEADGNIRIITRAGEGDSKRIIRDEPTDKEEIPFLYYYPDKKPNTIYPKAWFKDLISLQRGYNRTTSFIENYIFTMLWGRYIKKRGVKSTQEMTKHGQILTYDGVRPPTIQQLQDMPRIVLEYIGFLGQQMEDLTVHAESMGRKTSEKESGRAIALLQAADVQNLSTPLTNLEVFLSKVAKLILKRLSEQITSKEFTIDDETFKVIGIKAKDELQDVVKIGEFDEIDVEIVPGSAFGDYQQKEEALALKKEGVLDNEAVLEAFKWGAIKEVIDRMEVEKRIEEAKEVKGPTEPPPITQKPDLKTRESIIKE